jgi:hypothetical protein
MMTVEIPELEFVVLSQWTQLDACICGSATNKMDDFKGSGSIIKMYLRLNFCGYGVLHNKRKDAL